MLPKITKLIPNEVLKMVNLLKKQYRPVYQEIKVITIKEALKIN